MVKNKYNRHNSTIAKFLLVICLCAFFSHAAHIDAQAAHHELGVECHLCHNAIDNPPTELSALQKALFSYFKPFTTITILQVSTKSFVTPLLRAPPVQH